MSRLESVRRPAALVPPPFRHPHWESPRARQARLFKREIAEFVAVAEAQRQRLAGVRVLESVQ